MDWSVVKRKVVVVDCNLFNEAIAGIDIDIEGIKYEIDETVQNWTIKLNKVCE